jgi:hypothetical protein
MKAQIGNRVYEVKEKTPRSDKKVHVNPRISQENHKRLQTLAYKCSTKQTITKTHMAAMMIELCLSNPNIVEYFQQRFNVPKNERIIPVVENGKLIY